MKNYKIGFISLGCSKNLCDTEVMLHHIASAGYVITPEEHDADVIIVNTCAFIESAKKESIDNILDVAWLKENKSLKGIVVTGCMAERYREELLSEFPEIDAVLGVGSLDKITDAIDHVLANHKKKNAPKYTHFGDKETCTLGGDRVITTGETMAYMKIAEGCSNRCTYCAIPLIRGGLRSRSMEELIAEAKDLEAMGIRELNIIAQDTSAYGFDLYGEYKLPELLRRLTEETNIPWIRLLYCYPDKITDELVREIAENDRVVKYIDIPMQHISESVLKRMNRHGGAEAVKSAVKRLREGVPGIVLRSTAIVGFPGETEEDFRELCEFIKEARFERFGAFTYSREEDTPAYDFDGIVDEQTAQDRYDILMQTQLEVSESYNRLRVGKVLHVLCEGFDPVSEAYFGRSYAEAADIDGKIWFTSSHPVSEGEMIDVRITEALDYDLVGETVL
ncbi:MAG: 30S ribosomal protein S12 methylthiotransferase RimO [Clostridia bacterium]|nr:30S ribosomal protein S12 methylthiotransferase RimO [Clostridia bacterium]